MKAVASFLFYFLIILFLLIAITVLIIGTLFIGNVEFEELTGVNVAREIAKILRRRNERRLSKRAEIQGTRER